jgi:antirestriction protein ArdC
MLPLRHEPGVYGTQAVLTRSGIMKRDLYSEVSARIIVELERGAAPWVKPWSATAGNNVPCNAASNRPYSGCNVLLLWMAEAAGYRTPRYVTFKQALEQGGNVRKGEHRTKVYFVKQLAVRDEQLKDAVRLVPMLREYTVFNVDQCENLPEAVYGSRPMRVRNPDTRDQLADDFLRSTGADIREGHGEAYYVPSRDFISMPAFGAFKGADHFYNVAFHELTHWTGHSSRLSRDLKHRFGSREYAAEELVAELGAAFLSAEFGFDGDVRNAGYIGTWIDLLKADSARSSRRAGRRAKLRSTCAVGRSEAQTEIKTWQPRLSSSRPC